MDSCASEMLTETRTKRRRVLAVPGRELFAGCLKHPLAELGEQPRVISHGHELER